MDFSPAPDQTRATRGALEAWRSQVRSFFQQTQLELQQLAARLRDVKQQAQTLRDPSPPPEQPGPGMVSPVTFVQNIAASQEPPTATQEILDRGTADPPPRRPAEGKVADQRLSDLKRRLAEQLGASAVPVGSSENVGYHAAREE